MTRPLPVLLGLTVAAPLLLGLGGCSSDPYETYCERVEEHQAALGEAEALQAAGVTVAERVPHRLPANPHNARYLDTKRDRSGHLL